MHLQGGAGILVILGIAFLFSADRRRISWRLVTVTMLVEFAIAALFLSSAKRVDALDRLSQLVVTITTFADAGTHMLFGELVNSAKTPWGYIFAIKVLPVIIYFSALMAVLFHLGVMQRLITFLASIGSRTLWRSLSGTEAVVASANLFLGQTEAPLCIRPMISSLTQSQLLTVMACGFATMSAPVLATYATFLDYQNQPGSYREIMSYLLVATLMSIPAAVLIAKMLIPEERSTNDIAADSHFLAASKPYRNVLDAAATGATTGVRLAVNIAAMIVAFTGLIGFVNWTLQSFSAPAGTLAAASVPQGLTLESILGIAFKPVAWLIGVENKDCAHVASFLGMEIFGTEFLAYLNLGQFQRGQLPALPGEPLSHRSFVLAVFAMCSFANLPSIAVQIGGYSALESNRQQDFASIAPKAMIAGLLASWLTACVVSFVI